MIPDSHACVAGIRPVLISFFGWEVASYSVFMTLGIAAAVLCYLRISRLQPQRTPHSWTIIVSALFFGSIGAKLLSVCLTAGQYSSFGLMQFLYSGRSIIGGLIGGWFGVHIVKQALGIQTRHGNAIAPAAALGIAIGRLGCLLGSCCYGKPTQLPVGVDFGDGIPRHPTQLYESLFSLVLFVYFYAKNSKNPAPGILFRQFLAAYFVFRFVIEFIRVEPVLCFGLTVFQVLSLLVLAGLAGGFAVHRRQHGTKGTARADKARNGISLFHL